MEGATVTLVCPPQYALIGSGTTTCMGNGVWEPDPRVVECKGTYCKSFVEYTNGCFCKPEGVSRPERPIIINLICRP